MSEVSRDSRSGLIQAVVHLVNKNFDKLSQDFVKLGFLSEEVNLEPIVPAFQDVFINAVEQGVSKMDFKSVTDDMSGVMYKFSTSSILCTYNQIVTYIRRNCFKRRSKF